MTDAIRKVTIKNGIHSFDRDVFEIVEAREKIIMDKVNEFLHDDAFVIKVTDRILVQDPYTEKVTMQDKIEVHYSEP